MLFFVLKALHIIGVVCWFAGLFYIVRLFIYHVEAQGHPEPKRSILHEQFTVMSRRLWRAITVPSMVLTAATGGWLLTYHSLTAEPWLHLKFVVLALLFAYHFYCGAIRVRLAAGEIPLSATRLRMLNEVPTFLLVVIVFTAVSRQVSVGLWSLFGCAVVFALLVGLLLKKLQGKS